MRLDKFLKVSRVIKRRTVANEACDNGRVSINGKPAKAGTQVKVGDIVSVAFAGGSTEFEILATDDNVKKDAAREMYRIITSLIVCIFVSLTALGLSSCTLSDEDAPARKSFVGTVAGQEIYDEQYGYIMLNVAKQEAGFELSEDWIEDHKEELIEKTNEKCIEMVALSKEAEKSGMGYTTSEKERIYTEADSKISKLRKLEEYKKIDSDDEMCAMITGMSVNEYKRFAVLRGIVEKMSLYLAEDINPTEGTLANFYRDEDNKLSYRSITYIYKKLLDDEEESNENVAKEVLEIARSGEIDFDICAKGWSDAENVKKDGGVAVISRTSTEFPTEIVKWAFESEEPTAASDAKLIETDTGYYIVIRNKMPEMYNDENMHELVLAAYKAEKISEHAKAYFEKNNLKTEGFEEKKTTKAADDYLEAYFDQDFSFEKLPDTTPEPTTPPYEKISFEKASEDSYAKIGDTDIKSYCLACVFREKLDKLTREEEDYEKGISLEDYIEIRDRVLAEHKDEIMQDAVSEVNRLYIAYNEYLKLDGANISESVVNKIEDKQKYQSLTYFETLSPKYEEIKTPDDAMRFMCGANAEELIQYDIIRTYATQFVSSFMYKAELDNKVIEDYYKANRNRFRRVDLAVAIVPELEDAEYVKARMEENPKYAKNIANALRSEDNLERKNGVVRVTASTENLPGPIKEWAYGQTNDTLITEKGKAEIIGANGGYYVIACVAIKEYEDELGNTVYTEVAGAYKKEITEVHFTELEKKEEYGISDVDYDKIRNIIDNCLL